MWRSGNDGCGAEMSSASPGRSGARWLSRLATLSEPPRRIAAAFAIGVFLSFSPILGLQMAVGFGLSLALRLNRVALFAGLCTNLPWLMVPWYAFTTAAGAVALNVPVADDVAGRVGEVFQLPVYGTLFWRRAADLLSPFLWPFVIGSSLGALALGALAYLVTVRVIGRVHAGRLAHQETG
jgi:uncharacterized protein (DUF2062 family)